MNDHETTHPAQDHETAGSLLGRRSVHERASAPRGRLAGKVALVTGSSRGIGAAIARTFAAEGAHVAITYRENEERARELCDELDDALCLPLDVTRRTSVKNALERILDSWQRLDLLVNNAGYLRQEPFDEITEASWDRTLDTNLKGVFFCTQEASRRMSEGGSIVNVSSVGGQFGGPKAPHYAASKAAVLSFTKSTARLLAPRVRVNAIAPGFIRTDMYEDILSRTSEAAILEGIPAARVGEPEDVAEAAVYLASDAAGFVTGQVLNVNGGQWMG